MKFYYIIKLLSFSNRFPAVQDLRQCLPEHVQQAFYFLQMRPEIQHGQPKPIHPMDGGG